MSVAASILAFIGAVERLQRLCSNVKQGLRASVEIDVVLCEAQSLSAVLRRDGTGGRFDEAERHLLYKPIESCMSIVAEIESVVGGLFKDHQLPCQTALHVQYFRLRWAKKSKRIEILTKRL
jgi:hypothetical protein